jgi:excisionase family DNA binding protein
MKQFLSTKEAAKALNVVPSTIRGYIRDGRLKATKNMAGSYIIVLQDLKNFVFSDEQFYKKYKKTGMFISEISKLKKKQDQKDKKRGNHHLGSVSDENFTNENKQTLVEDDNEDGYFEF